MEGASGPGDHVAGVSQCHGVRDRDLGSYSHFGRNVADRIAGAVNVASCGDWGWNSHRSDGDRFDDVLHVAVDGAVAAQRDHDDHAQVGATARDPDDNAGRHVNCLGDEGESARANRLGAVGSPGSRLRCLPSSGPDDAVPLRPHLHSDGPSPAAHAPVRVFARGAPEARPG